MEENLKISILQILKESLRKFKNMEILIVTMTFILVGTFVSTICSAGDNLTIKEFVFDVLGDFISLIGYMTIIKIVEKKYKKEEFNSGYFNPYWNIISNHTRSAILHIYSILSSSFYP